MAAVGSEVAASWMMSSGAVSFLLLLLLLLFLSVFLASLCTDCDRRSFELRDPEMEKAPSALIRVVRLEDAMVARENPMILEIQNDEKDVVQVSNGTPVTLSVSPPSDADRESSRPAECELSPEEEIWYQPWRNHLGHQEADSAPFSEQHHPAVDPATNQEPASGPEGGTSVLRSRSLVEEEDLNDSGFDPMYARISRKVRSPTPPLAPPPEPPTEEHEEEEPSPSLPDRKMEA